MSIKEGPESGRPIAFRRHQHVPRPSAREVALTDELKLLVVKLEGFRARAHRLRAHRPQRLSRCSRCRRRDGCRCSR
jgi:hypothetical protein